MSLLLVKLALLGALVAQLIARVIAGRDLAAPVGAG
jgi:hypothetical protein